MAPELLLTAVAVFVAVALASVLGATWLLERNAPERRRLRSLIGVPAATTGVVVPLSLTTSLDPMLARLSRLMPRSSKDMSRLQRRLARAGFAQPAAAAYYAATEVLLPLGAGLLAFVLSGNFAVAILVAVIGCALPILFVRRKTSQRQKAIQNGLPDALDLITVCVEAGSGLDQAIIRASLELDLVHPALAEELRFITTETRAGKPRAEAFANFAKRTGVDDVRALVAMLNQTDRFGTSITQALRTHADTSRTKRRQRAEERAGKIGVKLVFPLAFCLFPALYIVCFGPVVVKIYRAFFTGSL
jgi:tight adherence protein C